MKKIIVFCLAVVLSLTFGIFTISCADAHSHTYTEEWSYDNDYHWHKCIATETCVAMTKHAKHAYEHEYVEEEDGVYKISTCSVCGFSQKTLDEHEHEFSNEWTYDDTHHWNDCTVNELCEEISNYEEHDTFTLTQSENNVNIVISCSVCDYVSPEMTYAENAILVKTNAEAQEALDNVGKEGYTFNTIVLDEGDFGTLYIRQNSETANVDMGNWAGGGHDYFRSIENLTILGSINSTLNTIKVEAHTYAVNGNQHSNPFNLDYVNSYISLTNICIENVTFALGEGQMAFNYSDCKVDVKGLTFSGCEFIADEGVEKSWITLGTITRSYSDVDGNVIIEGVISDITIEDCETYNLNTVIELRQIENFTATGNYFEGTIFNDFQFSTGDAVSTGIFVITDNISVNETPKVDGRFIRANKITDATFNIENNSIAFETGDPEFVKITNITNVEITLSGNDWAGEDDETAIANGKIVK